MNNSDYSIKSLIKEYGGVKKIIYSIDFIIATICSISFATYILLTKVSEEIMNKLIRDLANDLIIIAASLFGVLFAAFAIIVSLSDERFIKFLKKYNVFNKILLPFWIVSILYIIIILLNLLIKFLPISVGKYLMILSIHTFTWALLATILLVNDTINFGRRRADYLEYEKEIKEMK